MRRSLIISGIAHVVVLGWGIVAFAARPNDAPQTEALPVEFISATDYSQLSNGVRNAPKPIKDAKPLADKVGEPKPAKELAPKAVDKPEVKTDAAPPPKPEPKPETKAAEKIEKPKEPKPKDSKPADQIADALKKEELKKPPKKQPEFKPDQIAEELKKEEAKKTRPSPRFDADQVAALLDKRDPQRQLASAETLSNAAASLGAPTAHATQLSVSELDALRTRLIQCWSPPPGLDLDSKLYVVVGVQFKPDAYVAQEPAIIEDAAASLGPALAESAKRAVLSCQPFTMLKPEHYDLWKHIEIKFNNEMLGG
jgi:hypothetical protein